MNQQSNQEMEHKAKNQMSQLYYKRHATITIPATRGQDTWIKTSLLLKQCILYTSS